MPERFLGRTLGKFRIDGIVGSGGFAWVYKAYDPELEIAIALKVLKPQYAGDEQFEQRFRREASTAARLRHPNIIKIFAVGKEDDAVYFAMDYLPQGLPDRLEILTSLPELALVRMGIDVASALGFAHREGVVHRDIKVDNILFDEHGNAIVADFGIARAVSNYVQQTGTNMVVGTPQYFSPEQARGQPLDGRADIYSLGVTLYRAAAGVLPFTGDDWYEIARQHVEERPARPRDHNPQLSREIERVILRCLEKDPSARFQTGEALGQALAALSLEGGDTVAVRRASRGRSETPTAPLELPAARHKRWARRAVAGGAAAAAVIAMLVGLQLTGVLASLTGSARRAATTASADAPGGGPGGSVVAPSPPPPPGATDSAMTGATKPVDLPTVSPGGQANGPGGTSAHATASTGVTKGPTGTTLIPAPDASVSMPPLEKERGSGTVQLDTRPIGAAYTLEALDDGRIIRGRTPLAAPLTLPVGTYALMISAHYCATYRDTVRITLNHEAPPLHVRLVCGE